MPPVAADPAPLEELRLIDRIVAVVDEDPILLSEIDRALALGLIQAEAGESATAVRRRALDRLVEQRLRSHELERFGFEAAPLDEIAAGYDEIRARFATQAEFQAELERLNLNEEKLRQLVAHQVSVLLYVEERLGPRVFVSVDDIQSYYDAELVPELRGRGAEIPSIEAVREAIRAVLRERRLNDEIERWTRDLRSAADVEDFLDSPRPPLPPA